ncbi:MAG: ATP-binding cassette domain-containing protein, partial [Elusimicrobiales bacterium]
PVDENKLKEIYLLSDIERFKNEKVKNLSRGMLQKLSIACALVNDPKILVLDEPTEGLDPIYVKSMREILLRINEKGKTVFFSSHRISEIEKICSVVIVINRGRIIRVFDDRGMFKDSLESKVIESIEKDA